MELISWLCGIGPLAYLRSKRSSLSALTVAAIFWATLWGPIGLILSTPLTVCLVVLGRYVPQLGFLEIVLGSEPVLRPEERLYQRLLAGNVLMDRHAPAELLHERRPADRDCRALIRRWHGQGRLEYAITPRFSATSTPEQLHLAGQLAQDFPNIRIQTHLSENHAEVAWMRRLFPAAEDYLHTYEMFGLHTGNTVFAHCLHLSDDELSRIAAQGSSIAFCPASNLFLGSGLFDLARAKAHHIPIALATDVGAGTSLSQFRNMGDAYKVCQLKGYSLSAAEAFYMTTLGAARALHLDQHVGNLCPGREADFIEINAAAHPVVKARLTTTSTIEEELFVYMSCGDERLIASTTIAGEVRYRNPLID